MVTIITFVLTNRKWEDNRSLMRVNEANYIESFRLMICLEEAAERVQLEKCNQTDVQLYHSVDNEFYFYVEVIKYFNQQPTTLSIFKAKFDFTEYFEMSAVSLSQSTKFYY